MWSCYQSQLSYVDLQSLYVTLEAPAAILVDVLWLKYLIDNTFILIAMESRNV